MKHSDVDALYQRAVVQASNYGGQIPHIFAALVLEKAAQVCEGMHEEDRPGDYAYALRAMSAALQSGERG